MTSFKTHPIRLGLIFIFLMMSLSACFRDAGNGNSSPTLVNVSDLLPTQTRVRTNTPPSPPTFTPDTQMAATKTLVVGGPPIETTSDPNGSPTVFVPTFTSVPLGDATLAPPGFGDTGLSPTPTPTMTTTLSPLESTPTAVENQDECIYSVQGGDTLYSIALEYDLLPEDFYPVNPELQVNPNSLYIGQEIRIPGCVSDGTPTVNPVGTQATPQSQTSVPAGTQAYTVAEGDTLYSIATRFGVTVQAIVDATPFLVNENTIIRPGDVLVIPAP